VQFGELKTEAETRSYFQ